MPSKFEIGIGFVVPSTPFSRFYVLISWPASPALYFWELSVPFFTNGVSSHFPRILYAYILILMLIVRILWRNVTSSYRNTFGFLYFQKYIKRFDFD